MTFKESIKELIHQALNGAKPGDVPVGVAIEVLFLPKGTEGAQGRIVVSHLLHQDITHHEVDMLEDFAEALANLAKSRTAEIVKEMKDEQKH